MDKEQPLANERVQITKVVFDGLEFIRNSGVTNMFDRPTVLSLAREWDFTETADWIASADTATYGQLILNGAEVIEDDPTAFTTEHDTLNSPENLHEANEEVEEAQARIHRTITSLGRKATLILADSYETEAMDVFNDSSVLTHINEERRRLMNNLTEASDLLFQVGGTIEEIQRGIETLQELIDPENY